MVKFLNGSEDSLKLIELTPFKNYLQRWEFRSSVAYYLCRYAIQKKRELIQFGQNCTSNISPNYGYYLELGKNDDPYDCAMLSFCPDFCYGRIFAKNPSMTLEQANADPLNPCYQIRTGQCEVSTTENEDFSDLMNNYVNFTCECDEGATFYTKHGICIDIDECDRNSHDCNGKHETCLNEPFSFTCICKRGYRMKNLNDPKNRTCVRFSSLDEIETDILENDQKYNREILINMFKMIHKDEKKESKLKK